MINTIIILLFTILISVYCSASSNQIGFEPLKNINEDLISRGYKISFDRKSNEPYYLKVMANTKVIEGDLRKLCSIETLTTIEFISNNFPVAFANELNYCPDTKINFIKFQKMKIQPPFFCHLNKLKLLKELSLSEIDQMDNVLSCLENFNYLQRLELYGTSSDYSDEGFCKFSKSGVKIKNLYIGESSLSIKGYDCLLDFQGVETMSFKRWKNFSQAQMDAVADLYFKKNGKKIVVNTFEYNKP